MLVKITDLDQYLLTDVPGCPAPLRTQALHRAAIEYCRRSGSWRDTLEAVNMVDGQTEYQIESPYPGYILRVISAEAAGVALDNDDFTFDGAETFTLTSAPVEDTAGGLVVVASLVPDEQNCILDVDFLNQHGPAIVAYALYILKSMPAKLWSDRVGATAQYGAFMQAVAGGKIESNMLKHQTGNVSQMAITRDFF